jgi:hypothetical protein
VSSGTTPSPIPYRFISSGRVNAELRRLIQRAQGAGFGPQVLTALKDLQRILSIYPQYGDPLRNLVMPGEAVYAAAFPPLYIEYIIDEPNRSVFIVIPIKALPKAGFE